MVKGNTKWECFHQGGMPVRDCFQVLHVLAPAWLPRLLPAAQAAFLNVPKHGHYMFRCFNAALLHSKALIATRLEKVRHGINKAEAAIKANAL